MNLTKKLEAEILETYHTYWNAYINGNMGLMASCMHEDCQVIGSGQGEVFKNKKETIDYYTATASQVAGKSEIRNRKITVQPAGKQVLITEESDFFVLMAGTWTYYAAGRISTLFAPKDDQWLIIQQHGSLPDARTGGGEQINTDKVKEENIRLKDAVKRRTIELENKNRALEIEGALQRIRAEAVAMKESSDLLDIVVTMRSEFTKLGHEAHYFWHMMWLEEIYEKAMTSGDGTRIGMVMKLPRRIHGEIKELADWEKSDEPTVIFTMDADAALDYVHKMGAWGDFQNIDPNMPSDDDIRHIGGLTYVMSRTTHGEIGYSLPGEVENPPGEAIQILERFAEAFDLAHLRFLDLQKTEKQTREVQIELALEKVRSRSMAMHNSDELADLSFELVKQVQALGVATWFCAFNIYDEDSKGAIEWGSNGEGVFPRYITPREGVFLRYYEAGLKGEPLLINEIGEEECPDHYAYLCTLPGVGEQLLQMKDAGIPFPASQIDHVAFNKYGYILFITFEPAPESHDIFIRFAKVFEQTYTRFLDLKKAEAQAREAQIENALERVRSRTMAMQKSAELPEAANNLFIQVQELGIPAWSAGYCIWTDDKKAATAFMSSEGVIQKPFVLPNAGVGYDFQEPLKTGKKFHVQELGGDLIVEHYEFMRTLPIFGEVIDGIIEAGFPLPTFQIFHICYFKYGYVMFITYESVPEAHEIFKRFGNVFEQTYTRFLDLQKAETQAREAQIEGALEKVRSRTMAMQNSSELPEVANVLFTQVRSLGIPTWSAGYNILSEDKKSCTCIMSSEGKVQAAFQLPLTGEKSFLVWHQSIIQEEEFFIQELGGKQLEEHYKYLMALPDIQDAVAPLEEAGISLPTFQVNHLSFFHHGFLLFITYEQVPDAHEIFKRFTQVFEQTYTRFLDLERAEEQAREAQIEAALERTRTQSMLMQHSDELDATSKVFHAQLRLLGVETEFSYVWLPDEAKDEHQFWVAWNSENNKSAAISSKAIIYPLDKTEPYTAACFDDWKSGEPVHIHRVQPNEVTSFFSAWEELLVDAKNLTPEFYSDGLYYAEAFMKYGCFGINIKRPVTDEEKHILQRFSVEFERTYTRFLDLQKAEAQVRETQIEAALEKVRSRSLEMQKPEELVEVVKVIVEKLKELDVVLDANGVVLCTYFQDSKDILHWIVSPDYSFAGRYLLPYFDHPILRVAWKSKLSGAEYFSKAFTIEEKNSFWEHAFEHSDYKHFPEDFKQWVFQNDKHTLSFAWQKNSAILIPSHTGIVPTKSEREILIRFSNVFEQAYIRFMDLQVKEQQAVELLAEKQRLEKTLSDLQATQKQLIHAEKMASLGELTAGIAHEIQNPLNFVNNFSEVSKELIVEMMEEMEKGDHEEVNAISSDIIQNLDKILHHGKRADGIVKGMLQHSRSNSGEKEPTDISALADEYLRLAYHGLRAKDKSFNATLETDFDEAIGTVNVIPQDIGRVVLNLITNAFHTIKERSLQSENVDYKPTVSVTTKRLSPAGEGEGGGMVQITVSDNGSGIPDHIKDKVFQPFFTTKATGEGTGLGLSLSYDIVKAHGGELSCSSKVNEGTQFIIKLPVV